MLELIKLSTGTKFILLLFYGATIAMPFKFNMEIMNLVLVFLLFISIKKYKTGFKFVCIFLFLTALFHFTIEGLGIFRVFNTWSIIIRRFIIPIGIGCYFLYSTNINALMASMEKLSVPNIIIIPLVVMFRYLPVLKDEYGKIKNAMKIRGIETGFKSLKKPLQSMEYLLVPLLFTTFNIGDELSQAAFCKGVSIEGRKERYFATKFGICDFIIFLYLLIFIIKVIYD